MNILIKDIPAITHAGAETISVYISGNKIASIGSMPDGFKADKTIIGTGKLLIPGLINAHTHAAMTLFRNSADDLLFNDWLFSRIFPLEAQLQSDDVYWGVLLAVMEMLKSGTTTFLDMYFFTESYVKAINESGMRCVYSRGLLRNSPADESKLKEYFEEINRFKGNDKLSFMLAPHAPYTCDEGFQREIAQEAKRLNLGIHTHISESLAENKTIAEQYGCTPAELFDKNGLLTSRTVAAHCVHLSDSDIDLLAARGVHVATNPVSNLKLANGVAPVPKLLSAGINVALGTDGAASNNTLNMFRELTMLTLIHKGVSQDAQAVTAKQGFEMATKNGAAALGISDIGEIQAGKKADLVILNVDSPNMQPLNNPVSALAYSTNGSETECVIVDGEVLYENGEYPTIDKERVLYEISKICERIGTNK